MKTIPIKTRIFKNSENLFDFILEHIPAFEEESVLVITSKIAALAEGRVQPFTSKEDKIALIKQESELAIETPYTWLTIKDGLVMASAGIDESNADGDVLILLPKDSFKVAVEIRKQIMDTFGLKKFGVIVTDSRIMPLRRGTLGVAYGYAGFEPLYDYVGKPDIFGRPFKLAKSNIPDSLATAAVAVMGEGAEQQPLALITEFPLEWTDQAPDPDELKIPLEDDLYGPLFGSLK